MAQKQSPDRPVKPAQHQNRRPGLQAPMTPPPISEMPEHHGSGKLKGKVALITGGDSGIGRAVAIAFAKEGADVAISHLNEHKDAKETRLLVQRHHRQCLVIPGDIGKEAHCARIVERTVDELGRLDVLINNAAEQHPQKSIQKIDAKQLERTFRTNVYAMFFLVKAALKHMRKGACIINTTSVTAYRGSPDLLDYSATKGAIVSFTRSLAHALTERDIRVNAVAPGPIWTPLIPSTFPRKKVSKFGSDSPMGRPGEPSEVAPCFVFLASADASYMTGQVMHPNGGEVVNS